MGKTSFDKMTNETKERDFKRGISLQRGKMNQTSFENTKIKWPRGKYNQFWEYSSPYRPTQVQEYMNTKIMRILSIFEQKLCKKLQITDIASYKFCKLQILQILQIKNYKFC